MMEHSLARAIVDDYLQGNLEAADRDAFEAHVAGCGRCARELQDLRALLTKSRELPRSIDPPRDLWPRIESRLSAESIPSSNASRRRWPLRNAGALAAAAGIVVVLALAATLFSIRARDSYTEIPHTARAHFIETEKHYVAASAELEEALGLARNELSPETVELIDRNLAVIDEAIREIRAALTEEPNNREVMSMLASAYEKKLSLLRDVADLTSEL